jgi:hypothetical protein
MTVDRDIDAWLARWMADAAGEPVTRARVERLTGATQHVLRVRELTPEVRVFVDYRGVFSQAAPDPVGQLTGTAVRPVW